MGCWNQTCGLTQLYIKAGEDVIVFPLSKSRDHASLCYTTPFWTPYPVPFYSKYNDYGAGEDSSGVGLEIFLGDLSKRLVEVEQGENQYHDIAVKRDGFNEELFWEAIHEQRLAIESRNGLAHAQVGMVMIKQNVVDHLIANHKFEVYLGYTANQSEYFHYTFQRVLDDLPAFVDVLLSPTLDDLVDDIISGLEISEEDRKKYRKAIRGMDPLSSAARGLLKEDRSNGVEQRREYETTVNRAASWLEHKSSHLSYGFFSSHVVYAKINELVDAADRSGLIALLTDMLKLEFVDSIMMSTRKFWSPQASAGSQSQEAEAYEDLMAAMAHAIALDRAEYDEE